MDLSDLPVTDAASVAAYFLFGVVGTVIAAIAALALFQPVQPLVYDAFYRRLGPWTATTAATIVHFGIGGVFAVGIPVVAAELLDGTRAKTVSGGLLGAAFALIAVLLATAFLGALGFLTVIVAYAVLVVVAFAGLRRLQTSRGSKAAFVGGLPVLALLVLLLGVGLGWGGGYDVVAEPVPASTVDEPATDFSNAPDFRADLFSQDAHDPSDDVYRLPLRDYDHEAQAGRALDNHGVRCPLVNAPASDRWNRDASFVAEHDGDYYRITCQAYGD